MDPNDNPTPEVDDDTDTGAPEAPPVQDEVTPDQKVIDAFDEGAGLKDGDDDDEADGAAKPAGKDGAGGDADALGEGDDDDADPTETPEQKAEREREEAEAAVKAEVDNEVAELKLKGKAEERFRDLTGRVRELSTKIEQLGGDEGLQRIVRDAEDQRQWDEKLHEIGATPDQFGQAMGFIAAINSNDPTALQQAHDNLLAEAKLIAQRLGIESPTGYDPLSDHPDLQDKVQRGAIDREDALETARLRGAAKARQEDTQRGQQRDDQRRALEEGGESLRQLGGSFKQRDGEEVFGAVMKTIADDLNAMSASVPPTQWKDHAARLYEVAKRAMGAAAAAPAPVPPRPRPGVKAPMRQTHGTRGAAAVTKEHLDPIAAFDAGVEEARARGR